MQLEYRVVSAETLTKAVSLWQGPAARAKAYGAELEKALNRMAGGGWRFVETHKEPWSGSLLFVFEREVSEERHAAQVLHEDHHNGIQAMKSGIRE